MSRDAGVRTAEYLKYGRWIESDLAIELCILYNIPSGLPTDSPDELWWLSLPRSSDVAPPAQTELFSTAPQPPSVETWPHSFPTLLDTLVIQTFTQTANTVCRSVMHVVC